MRISGGTARGKVTAKKDIFLKGSPFAHLRPTSSKVREALFDILRGNLDGSVFADIYAGTGTVGLEALSRGASKALFIEQRQFLINLIGESAKKLGFEKKITLIRGEAEDFFKQSAGMAQTLDILFLDPPYHSDEIERILPIVAGGKMVKQGGIIVAEHFFKRKMPKQTGDLHMRKQYRYGDTGLTVYIMAKQ